MLVWIGRRWFSLLKLHTKLFDVYMLVVDVVWLIRVFTLEFCDLVRYNQIYWN
jgi:hypothetical protein